MPRRRSERPPAAYSRRRISRGMAAGRAILERRIIHIHDVREDPEYTATPIQSATLGYRTVLAVPLLRDAEPIGALVMWRREVKPFSQKQIDLMTTFADQAVIAIENVRLFTELEARNRDLTEALEQQTATSEILRVISSSPTDVQPVFDTIADAPLRLCEGLFGAVFRFDGKLIHIVAHYADFTPEGRDGIPAAIPGTAQPHERRGRAILDRGRRPRARLRARRRCHPGQPRDVPRRGSPTVSSSSRCSARGRPSVPSPWGDEHGGPGPSPIEQISASRDLRRPGRHRHRERPPVHGARGPQPRPHRGPRAADGHQRDPARHLELAHRRPARLRHDRRERQPAVQRPHTRSSPASTAS